MSISGITKINSKCLVSLNYGAVPTYFYAATPMDIESCLEYTETIADSNLAHYTTTIPNSSLVSINPSVWGGSVFPISILPITKSIFTPCSTPVTNINSFEHTSTASFTVFPNPTQHNLTIRATYTIQKIEVVNALGAIITSIHAVNANEVFLELPNHTNAGLYIIRVISSNGIETSRFIKN